MIKYLGIDYGEKRIGLALADSETKIATPFKVVKNLYEIIKLIKTEGINELVIGIPYQITNYQLPITNEFKKFIETIKNEISLPIRMVDERLSSKAADALFGDKKTKAQRDTIAAMLILQNYLDRK